MNLLEAVKICAFHDVTAKVHSRDYFIRHISRWYSKTFSTPLKDVENIPLEDILTAYYEERYEGMDPEELEHQRALICETEEERKRRLAAEEAEEQEDAEWAKEVEREEMERVKRVEEKRSQKKLAEVEVMKPSQIIVDRDGNPKALVTDKVRESDEPMANPEEPLISMTFVDEAAFSKEIEGLGGMAPPVKKP